jgi:hypothetical protein
MSTSISDRVDDLISKILSNNSALRVKDIENVRMKISRILEGRLEKLHVISGKYLSCKTQSTVK